jgi:AcrR family transcriptional regulator
VNPVEQVSWPVVASGAPPAERADAARNRVHLLATAREMLAEQGADTLTMDALAERAGLGKGTVFRRFGTRAGIFQALLDDAERTFQEQVLSGPPPLGPGADPLDRLVAYGRARIAFLIEHRDVARASLDGSQPIPAGHQTPLSQLHIRVLLGQMDLGPADLDMLAVQLTAALDGPLLLYLSSSDLAEAAPRIADRIECAWTDLIHRVCRRAPSPPGAGRR